ncbi:MAG: HEAT repeat domain-containing protein [Limisphaerales bacterium]
MTISQKKWLLAALVLLVAAGGWFFFRRPAEPEYAGKSLSYWFREYCGSGQRMTWNPGSLLHEETGAALRQMGTNAVPYLLEKAFDTRPSSGVRKGLYRLLNRLPRSWGLPIFVDPAIMSSEAAEALKEIKPPANQLLPFLERHLGSTDFWERRQALYILGSTGEGAEQAVHWLCAALKSPDVWERRLAVQSLGWIGPNARAAVPALIEVLKAPPNTNQPPVRLGPRAARRASGRWLWIATNQPPVRLGPLAAVALGEIGSAAAPALPLVQGLFEQETNWNLRCSLAVALCHIDGDQTNALAFLTNGLATHEPASERWIAACELGNVGPDAKAAVPLLLAALDGTNDMLFSQVPGVLMNMGVPTETFLPRMKIRLRSENETSRLNAAVRVLELDAADDAALVVLMDQIKRWALFRDFAIETLGRTGPPAAEAIPVLREVVKHGSNQEREAARQALRRIEPKAGEKH